MSISRSSSTPPSSAVLLVPARLFIGAGWMRAAVEKAGKPGWFDGRGVTDFLDEHSGVGFFDQWIEVLFGGSMAGTTAVVVYVLQVLVGLGLLLGAATSALLLVGISMNLVFLLAGAPNPSVFYILIQLVLLWGCAGSCLGLDSRSKPGWSPLVVANSARAQQWFEGRLGMAQAAMGLALTVAALPYLSTIQPSEVIEDPAAMAGVCGLLPVGLLAAERASRWTSARDLEEGS